MHQLFLGILLLPFPQLSILSIISFHSIHLDLQETIKTSVDTFTCTYSRIFLMFLNFISFSERSVFILSSVKIHCIKQITTVVPEMIDLEYAWGSRSRTRQIRELTSSNLRNWPEIPCIFIETDNPPPPKKKKKTYIFT